MFPPIFLAQLDTAIKTLDHAAAMDMKWWFLGMLAIFLGSTYLRDKKADARHDALAARLDKVQDDHTSYLKDCNGRILSVIERSNEVFAKFTEICSQVKALWAK